MIRRSVTCIQFISGMLCLAALLLAGCESQASSLDIATKLTPSLNASASMATEVASAIPATQPGNSGSSSPGVITADVAPAEHADRLVIYNAALTLVVADVAHTLDTIHTLAASSNGYLQEIDGQSISIRVPAAKFHDAIAAIEKLGEVTQRHVKAEDITEEMHDLNIRLENAEQIRKELLGLIEKSQKMEDTLKIEQEIMRVTQEVELLKGKIQFYASQAAFSTIRVDLNSPLPQRQMVAQIPFAWIRQLGDGLVAGTAESMPDTSRWQARNTRFDLPKNYVRYYEREHLTEAMSADGIVIRLQRFDNYDGGDVAFWSALARKALVENRAIAITAESQPALRNKAAAQMLIGSKDMAGRPAGYLLGIVATKRYVYAFEAWGPSENFKKDQPALREAFTTLDAK